MVNATEVNAILEGHIQEQEKKNAEYKFSIDELKQQMAAMIRQQTAMQNSINQLIGHVELIKEPPKNQRDVVNEPHDQVRGVKLEVPELNGDTRGDVFLDWIYSLESFFRWHNMSDARKIYFAESKLRGTARMRWDKEKESSRRVGRGEILLWEEMKASMQRHFLLANYKQQNHIRFIQLRQDNLSVADYTSYKLKVKDIVQSALFPEAGLENGVGHAGGVGGLVIVRDLDLFSYCESCLLPFQVKCHVGYVPSGQRVVGLSKLSRVADVFAKRLQDPQRLADDVCSALHYGIMPTGVAVVLQCSHIHFPNFASAFLNSNHQGWFKVVVTSGSGVFENAKEDIWGEFLSLLRFRGIDTEDSCSRVSGDGSWCPSQNMSKMEPANLEMVNAVTSIIQSLGEDPLREQLLGTPTRFVKWLMNFRNTDFEMKLHGLDCYKINLFKSIGDNGHTEESIQSELNLSIWSQCEHHLLPFHGVVHIGYFGTGIDAIGVSLLQSIVHFHGFKLQVQERLTRQIAETVSLLVGKDVMVVVECNHTCMISRGIEKFGSSTATMAVLGRFSTEPAARVKFLHSIPSPLASGV